MDPGELVSSIFALVVALAIFVVLLAAFQGGDVLRITNLISTFAVPFIFILLFIFFIATLITELL